MKVLVLFPGQEAFFKGMGSEIVGNYPEVLKYYEKCKKKTGLDIIADCIYSGGGRELTQEEKKISVLVTSVVNYQVFNQTYENADHYFAGEGIGFLAALVCSRTISLLGAIRLIKGKKPYAFLMKKTFNKVLLPSTGKIAQSKREVIDDIYKISENSTALSMYMESAVEYQIEAGIDCGPNDLIARKLKTITNNIPFGNLDRADDPNYILEGFEYKKLFNRYYCSLRVLGIMSSCKNNNLSSDEYRTEMLDHFQAVKNIVDKATMRLYQSGIMDITQEEFNECFERLDNVFKLKKVSEDEIEKRIEKLEMETALKIKDAKEKRGDKAIAG